MRFILVFSLGFFLLLFIHFFISYFLLDTDGDALAKYL